VEREYEFKLEIFLIYPKHKTKLKNYLNCFRLPGLAAKK